jgi:hypothetical protein
MTKDRAHDPRRVPPISFPLPSTVRPGRDKLRLDATDRIKDRYTPGSQNPIVEMFDPEESEQVKRDNNG